MNATATVCHICRQREAEIVDEAGSRCSYCEHARTTDELRWATPPRPETLGEYVEAKKR